MDAVVIEGPRREASIVLRRVDHVEGEPARGHDDGDAWERPRDEATGPRPR